MDAPDANILSASYDTTTGTTVEQLVDRGSRAALSRRLGYRASDLVQSNAVVGVEGPSDRIYIHHWINKVNPNLLEGTHYSILFYAGRLLSHYSGNELDSLEASVGDFISLLDVNRNMAIVIDSDRKNSKQKINATKTRLVDEFNKAGAVAWVTAGREIENIFRRTSSPQQLNKYTQLCQSRTTLHIMSSHPVYLRDNYERHRAR
jgi:predicted ATP-dependent endonuclease of OLD family